MSSDSFSTGRSYVGGRGLVKGRVERFLGGSQGGVLCNLAVDKILSCRSGRRFRGSCNDELVNIRYWGIDAQYWQSWSCAGQHVLEKLLPLSCMIFPASVDAPPALTLSFFRPNLFRDPQ